MPETFIFENDYYVVFIAPTAGLIDLPKEVMTYQLRSKEHGVIEGESPSLPEILFRAKMYTETLDEPAEEVAGETPPNNIFPLN